MKFSEEGEGRGVYIHLGSLAPSEIWPTMRAMPHPEAAKCRLIIYM